MASHAVGAAGPPRETRAGRVDGAGGRKGRNNGALLLGAAGSRDVAHPAHVSPASAWVCSVADRGRATWCSPGVVRRQPCIEPRLAEGSLPAGGKITLLHYV
jgi:hypothetical protein